MSAFRKIFFSHQQPLIGVETYQSLVQLSIQQFPVQSSTPRPIFDQLTRRTSKPGAALQPKNFDQLTGPISYQQKNRPAERQIERGSQGKKHRVRRGFRSFFCR